MATSGKRLDWRIVVGIVVGIMLVLAALVAAATVNPGPGPAILLALPGGTLIAAGVRAYRKAALPADRTETLPPPGS
jgi:hypothetical protein